MKELKFDTEGTTSCPMNEVATINDCRKCNYLKEFAYINESFKGGCRFEDQFPEPEEEK